MENVYKYGCNLITGYHITTNVCTGHKILWQSHCQNLDKSKMKLSNLNCDGIKLNKELQSTCIGDRYKIIGVWDVKNKPKNLKNGSIWHCLFFSNNKKDIMLRGPPWSVVSEPKTVQYFHWRPHSLWHHGAVGSEHIPLPDYHWRYAELKRSTYSGDPL